MDNPLLDPTFRSLDSGDYLGGLDASVGGADDSLGGLDASVGEGHDPHGGLDASVGGGDDSLGGVTPLSVGVMTTSVGVMTSAILTNSRMSVHKFIKKSTNLKCTSVGQCRYFLCHIQENMDTMICLQSLASACEHPRRTSSASSRSRSVQKRTYLRSVADAAGASLETDDTNSDI